MDSGNPKQLTTQDATKTYRYLRIGMIGAVVLLAASIIIEHDKVGCWQTSISAYYYTPARAIFVGGLMAVALALIVIKGKTPFEDICLNGAGMLAPVVAIAPTTDVGRCWSVQPSPLPIDPSGELATWVVTNIDNNFHALLLAGVMGLIAAVVIALLFNQRSVSGTIEKVETGTLWSLAVTAVVLGLGWWLIETWDDFSTRAHGYAAVLMFVFLIGAVARKAWQQWRTQSKPYFKLYLSLAVVMPVGGIVIAVSRIASEHTVFVLEAFEITLFAVFWLIQTRENWDEGLPSTA